MFTYSSMAVKFVGGMLMTQVGDTRVRHGIYLRGGFSLQTSQFSDHPYQWAPFLPGERGLHFDINPAVLFSLQVEGVFLTRTLNSCFRKNVSITVNLTHIAPMMSYL
jgi:hypothetical protein